VEELEDEEGFDLGRGGEEKEQGAMVQAEDERGWVGVGQVDETRPRRRVFEV